MAKFKFKRSDVSNGILVCPDKHLASVQENFIGYKAEVLDSYKRYLDKLLDKFKFSLVQQDENDRNPVHYASLSKFTKFTY